MDGEDDQPEDMTDTHLPPSLVEYQPSAKKRKTRADGEPEPVFYQSMKSAVLWSEILYGLCVDRVVAFTAGDGLLLEACLMAQIPALGFCFTQKHADGLFARLVRRYLKDSLLAT